MCSRIAETQIGRILINFRNANQFQIEHRIKRTEAAAKSGHPTLMEELKTMELPNYLVRVSVREIKDAKKAEIETLDLKETIRKRIFAYTHQNLLSFHRIISKTDII
ncbi:hypothetical protein ZOSMA_681G00010 [Zostera marina]|uniref:Uncharacterized protein n=1 Tax=Zostera marina TaxID=29655 RepID=A0A0K9NSC9_ZOSMR|nr:hypothetical protein ZOSMA_681G00010 [Zostera marina]